MITTAGRLFVIVIWLCMTRSIAGDSPVSQHSDAPILYSDIPLSAQPGSVLQLTGAHLSSIREVTLTAPNAQPLESSHASTDIGGSVAASIIARSEHPERLTIQIPADLVADTAYAIRVVTDDGTLSNAVALNAPAPIWFSPAVVTDTPSNDDHQSALKIVGRNLHCRSQCRVRLSGPVVAVLRPSDNRQSFTDSTDETVVGFKLPDRLAAGSYRVEYSDDVTAWQSIGTSNLQVTASAASAEVSLLDPRFGACVPDDKLDDTDCLQRALEFAATRKLTIMIPAGRWDLYSRSAGESASLRVAEGVQIRGATNGRASLIRHDANGTAAFITLSGRTAIRRLWLSNADNQHGRQALIQLGMKGRTGATLQDITIEDSHFSNADHAIIDGGLPIRHLIIVNNDFRISGTALYLTGNRYQNSPQFSLSNSLIAGNTFHAGDRSADPAAAPIASEIGGSAFLDFSNNKAVVNPDIAAKAGWRAGFFFHLQSNHEHLLVQDNLVQCAGSGGDGEAIALDNNGNVFAHPDAQSVQAASTDSVTIHGLPEGMQNGVAIDQRSYYLGHWLQIVDGAGSGQARRISAYDVDVPRGITTYRVTPAFQMAPDAASSRIMVSRLFMAPTITGNLIDNRLANCAKNNLAPRGGAISLWAQTHGGMVSGNRQYNTDGIVVKHTLGASRDAYRCKDCEPGMIRHVALNLIHNQIIGEFDWASSCSSSGIQIRYGAAPTSKPGSSAIGINTRIISNTVSHADGASGGGISFMLDWYAGPAGSAAALIDGTIVEGNMIEDIAGPVAIGRCGAVMRRGIQLGGGHLAANTVLHRNTCHRVTTPLSDQTSQTIRMCSNDTTLSDCECNSRANNTIPP